MSSTKNHNRIVNSAYRPNHLGILAGDDNRHQPVNCKSNPYQPPPDDPAAVPAKERRNLLVEALRALIAIFGILVGWGLIGFGIIESSTVFAGMGTGVMLVGCVIGLQNRHHSTS